MHVLGSCDPSGNVGAGTGAGGSGGGSSGDDGLVVDMHPRCEWIPQIAALCTWWDRVSAFVEADGDRSLDAAVAVDDNVLA